MFKPIKVIILVISIFNVSLIQTTIMKFNEIMELPDDYSFPLNNSEEEQESTFVIKLFQILTLKQIRYTKNILLKEKYFTLSSIVLMLPFLSVETPPPNFV